MKKNKTIYWLLVICLLFSLVGCNGDDETPTVPIDEFDLTSCDLSDLIHILENVSAQGAIINIANCTYEVNSIHNTPASTDLDLGHYSGVGLPLFKSSQGCSHGLHGYRWITIGGHGPAGDQQATE